MKPQFKIGNVKIPNRVIVAPMAGVTNPAFRMICKEFGAGLVVCEMISDRGIIYRNKKTLKMMQVDPREHPMSMQIFGNSKETLAQAAQYIEKNTNVDIIDINMGCPVNKVVKTGAGSRWLLDPDKIYDMVSYVTSKVDLPITVKMRTGWDDDHLYAVDNALAAQAGGASAVAMHGRTREQYYRGHANWNILKNVAKHLTIPFIGNGDVKTPEDAKKMIDDVGADGVMIARAVEGNPWMLKQTSHYLATGDKLPDPSLEEKINVAREHLHRLVGVKGSFMGPRVFRGQAAYYLKGISHSARTRAALNDADTEQEMNDIFDQFIEKTHVREARKANWN
ncbi:tRNA-dihydrouridine synthase [Philodulcilactobacillus myokoensis]|uniref:tRNA-dihydrouridine synthase n=1 Tax=Philodulcilactobacillus myokoensis TaxID=2929573 RepID=A0A9W6ET70_9LACO|nr:tRNA dihydrouridine synthase DusB [Philodulcilactobacillus myokoensis]GLB47197.1 tRNA-dihydrouridine synthase [Philodulcilactobacillus myokoensis]